MPVVRLTDIAVRAFKAGAARVTYWDETLPAFGVRVGRRAKVFILMHGKARKRIVIGRYPAMSLQVARQRANSILHAPDTGQQPDAPLARDAVTQFIDLHHAQSRPRTRKEQERLLTNHVLSKLGEVPLNRITRPQLLAITDDLKHVPSEQIHVHRALKTFFRWAVQREMIPVSPIADVPLPTTPQDRNRLLSDDELARIYRAAVDLAYPFGYIVLIAIHTGLRRGEVGLLKWSYITPDYITIPKEITKNRPSPTPSSIGSCTTLIASRSMGRRSARSRPERHRSRTRRPRASRRPLP